MSGAEAEPLPADTCRWIDPSPVDRKCEEKCQEMQAQAHSLM